MRSCPKCISMHFHNHKIVGKLSKNNSKIALNVAILCSIIWLSLFAMKMTNFLTQFNYSFLFNVNHFMFSIIYFCSLSFLFGSFFLFCFRYIFPSLPRPIPNQFPPVHTIHSKLCPLSTPLLSISQMQFNIKSPSFLVNFINSSSSIWTS